MPAFFIWLAAILCVGGFISYCLGDTSALIASIIGLSNLIAILGFPCYDKLKKNNIREVRNDEMVSRLHGFTEYNEMVDRLYRSLSLSRKTHKTTHNWIREGF
jgi:hypothetical protein